jgi:hypothetical protein
MAQGLISLAEKKKLYTKIYHALGAPVREIQITDEQLDTLLENAIEDYSKFINEWLVDQQWSTVSGLNIEEADFNVAFSTKSLDFVKSFTYAYSRQVGLGTNAPAAESWELKKDYITISADTQFYIIPKGREVNEVLWHDPSFMVYDGLSANGGFIGQEFGWVYNGTQMGTILPAYSTMLGAADRKMKSKLMRSEMTYRITGNADGTKTLHLYPVPGGPYQPRGFGQYFSSVVNGTKVWYWYYETTSKNKNKCLQDNNDIAVVVRPSDAPIKNLSWGNLNDPAKTWVREYLQATAKILLGYVRGTYSGNINISEAEVQMDYSMYLEDGRLEKDKLTDNLRERLDSLTYESQLIKRGNEAEALNKTLGYVPLPIFVI